MSTPSIAILSAFALCALLLLAAIAVERAARRVGPPLGIPPPTGRCPRCGRNNLERDRAGLVAHYPHRKAEVLCQRRIH